MTNKNLTRIIKQTLEFAKSNQAMQESWYFDFKLNWDSYSKNDKPYKRELLYDIICLANASPVNSTPHTQERYLIIGISDDVTVYGVEEKEQKKDQWLQQILYGNKNDISGGLPPSCHLENIVYEDKIVQIIVIQDMSQYRPYMFVKDLDRKNGKIQSLAVYTRHGSSNELATALEIESMYRTKFGIAQDVRFRLELYMLDLSGWTYTKQQLLYYKKFPEFHIDIKEAIDKVWGREENNQDHIQRSKITPLRQDPIYKQNGDVPVFYCLPDEYDPMSVSNHYINFANVNIRYNHTVIMNANCVYFINPGFGPQIIPMPNTRHVQDFARLKGQADGLHSKCSFVKHGELIEEGV